CRSPVAPFRYQNAMPPEESKRVGYWPGCPNLDGGSQEAEVGLEPRTFRKLLTRLLKTLRQPMTGFVLPLRAHQIGEVPEFSSTLCS
ncbi:hypothetical protein T265_12707, partial [Opisthorchis viverrini]